MKILAIAADLFACRRGIVCSVSAVGYSIYIIYLRSCIFDGSCEVGNLLSLPLKPRDLSLDAGSL